MNLIVLPAVFNEARVFLADAGTLPAGFDGSGDGWGGLVALVLLVATILFAMYIAAREEWQFAQQTDMNRGARRDPSSSFKGRTAA